MREPLQFLKRLEAPLTQGYYSLFKNYPFLSKTPISKFLVNTSIGVFLAWNYFPYQKVFRHCQISEYTISRGWLHSTILGSLSHRDVAHLAPNLMSYWVLGKLIETQVGSRKLFYLFALSAVAGILTIVIKEKVLEQQDGVQLIIPKCNGSVIGSALAGAILVRFPWYMINPLGLKRNAFNEVLMLPACFISAFYGMLEYQIWSQGNVDYICKEAHLAGFLTGVLYSIRFL